MIRNIIFSKKNVIYSVFLDVLVISFYLLSNRYNYSDCLLSLFFIILIGYIIGKYHNYDIRKYNSILKISFKLSINILIYYLASLIILNLFSISIFKYEILSFIFVSYFTQLFINLFLAKFIKRINKYLVVSSSESFNKLKSLDTANLIFEHKDIADFLKLEFDGSNNQIIFYPENIIEKNLINKMKMKIIDFSDDRILFDWCNKYIFQIPVDFFENSNLESLFYKNKYFFFEMAIKRFADIIFSFLLLILTFPLLIISALFIYLEDRGPIIYKQLRTGKYKKTFNIYKLRTMKVNAEVEGAKWSKQNDIRITKIGNFLRRTRIDELPQLINVIKGEMSLIGPRPERPEFDKILSNSIPHYFLRYNIKPGLSGWAQVNYNYTASKEDSKFKLGYDLFYLSNFSCILDLIIFFKTIRAVFNAKGAIAN